jgi:integrase
MPISEYVTRSGRKHFRAWDWYQGRRIDRRAPTKREALAKVKAAIAALGKEPTVRASPDLTLDVVVERHLAEMPNREMARGSAGSWRRHGQARLGALPLRALDVPEVVEWRKALDADHRKRDPEIAFETLRAAIDKCVESGVVASNPCRQLAKRRRDRGRRPQDAEPYKTFTKDELRAMLDAARGERLGGVVWLMAGCGLRTGEALGLDWSSVKGNTIKVEQQLVERYDEDADKMTRVVTDELKTRNSHRTIHIEDDVLAQLGERKRRGLVFQTTNGQPVWRDKVRGMWRRVLREAGVKAEGRNLYNLRHTHATLLIDAKLPVHQVADRLGDVPDTVLKFYARKSRERVEVSLLGSL